MIFLLQLERSDSMEQKEDIRELCGNLAVENFKSGLNCCESVYNALLRAGVLEGVDPKTQAMCIGLSGHTCGALSGMVMAGGALYGRPDPYAVSDDVRMKEIAGKYYRRYNKMVADFNAAFGSTNCRDICAAHGEWASKDRKKNCLKMIASTAKMAYDNLQISQEEAFAIPYEKDNMGGAK